MDFTKLATQEQIDKVIRALNENGIEVVIAENKNDAKEKVLDMIPKGSEVMDMTSVSLLESGITEEIEKSGKYISVKNKLYSLDRETQKKEMNILGATSDYSLGSVHAVTEGGEVVIASNTGSQIPAYAYGSPKVIWVVGTQKIVKDMTMAMKRVYDYVLPLESDRAHKAYGVSGSNVSKILILNKEITPKRITMILVKEKIGF
ncbi:MAG: lactate utilization protein [Candidatus Levybacteria bacterium]|nr:lactate utilization protein [Candidatus Levybacteria bacterium]